MRLVTFQGATGDVPRCDIVSHLFWLSFIRPAFIGELLYILDLTGNELTLKETASEKASRNKSAECMASSNV